MILYSTYFLSSNIYDCTYYTIADCFNNDFCEPSILESSFRFYPHSGIIIKNKIYKYNFFYYIFIKIIN